MVRGDVGVWWPLRLHADTPALDPYSFSTLLKERVSPHLTSSRRTLTDATLSHES